MKQRWFSLAILLSSLLFSSLVSATSKTITLLEQMRNASLSLNYEMLFVNINTLGIDSMRFRHAVLNKQTLAQLLKMDGASREILLRGAEISYFFEHNSEPFSISGDHIVDSLPSLVFADFNQLEEHYDFQLVGRQRIANRACQAVHVVSRDNFRYNYMVWIDEKTYLPLQIELLDHNGERLEQFRVLSFIVGQEVLDSMRGLATLELPPLLEMPLTQKVPLDWKPSWLPAGFDEISSGQRELAQLGETVESRLYSDGLFSFSISVSSMSEPVNEQALKQGKHILLAKSYAGYEVVIVGEIPLSTATRIADSLQFS